MEVIVNVPAPHSFQQKILMEFFVRNYADELWMACGSKLGKTIGGSVGISQGALIHPNTFWRWVAPIYEQAKLGFNEIKQIMPPKPYTHVNLSGPRISIPAINTIIEFWHGQKPESLEGGKVKGYVLDECAKMKKEVFESAYTTTTRTLGKFVCLSTPLGKGWFYTKCMEAKDEMEWALNKGIRPKKLFLTAPTSANPFISKERIEEARRSMPDRLFRQYFLAEFLDDSSVFIGFKRCICGDKLELPSMSRQYWLDKPKEHYVVIGADWAKKGDYTVFIAIDYTTNPKRIVGFMRFHGIAYTSAVAELVRFARQWKKCELIYHDKTGLGEVIDDLLVDTDLTFEGITFTNASKSHMINQLIVDIEQRNIMVPHWDTLISEMDAFEVKVSPIGTLSYSAPSGQHDDTVCSLMLANAASTEFKYSDLTVKTVDDYRPIPTETETKLKKEDELFVGWYDKIISDEDDLDSEIITL